MRVAVDMDEVIADALPAQLGWLADRFGYALSLAECEGRRLSELLSAPHRDELEAHLHEGRFFGELLPMPGAEAALTLLNERTEHFVTTAAMEYPRSLPFKFEWLRERFPFLDPLRFVFCGDKGIIAADYLVDDNARHFERFGGEGILFSAPHNAAERRYRRASTWPQVLGLLGLA